MQSLYVPVHRRGEIDWPVSAYVAQRVRSSAPTLRFPVMADFEGRHRDGEWRIIASQYNAVYIQRPDDRPVEPEDSDLLFMPISHIDLKPMRIFARYDIDQDRDGVEFMLRYGGDHPTAIPYEFEVPAEIVERDIA